MSYHIVSYQELSVAATNLLLELIGLREDAFSLSDFDDIGIKQFIQLICSTN